MALQQVQLVVPGSASIVGGVKQGTGVTISPDGTLTATGGAASIPAGTLLSFPQAAAPTGWTQVGTFDDASIRLVGAGGGGGTGGSVGFTTVFSGGLSTNSYALQLADIPSHSHSINDPGHQHPYANSVAVVAGGSNAIGSTAPPDTSLTLPANTGITINNSGGGGGHSHSMPSFAVKYVNYITCSKN
jgi:hypothetical protein